MGQKSKFLVKHGLAVNTQSGTTTTLNYPTTDGSNFQYIRTDGQGNLQFDSPGGGGGGTFLSLGDTPATYAGSPGRVLVVNDSGNGLTLSASPLNNSQSRFEFTGDGSTVNFVTGTTQFTTVDHILVYVDGVIQAPTTNFTLDSTVITFTSAPANNADILVFGTVTASGFPQGLIDSDALTNPLGLRGRLNAGGHIVPKVDSAYDLGDSALKWRDLYMAGSTIHIGGVTIKSDGSGVILPANSKIGNRRFGGSRQDSAEKGFDSDLKGTYGSTTAIPILKIDSAGFIDSVGTASIISDLIGDTTPQLGGNLDLNSKDINGTGNISIIDSSNDIFSGKFNLQKTSQAGGIIGWKFDISNPSGTTNNMNIARRSTNGNHTSLLNIMNNGHIVPAATNQQDLGESTIAWRALYVKDINVAEAGTIVFEGDSTNSNETTLTAANPTADRTITLPDATGTVVTKSVYTGGGHDPSAQLISLKATNNQGTANLQIAAQGATLLAAQTDASAIYSNPTNNGFFTFSDLHIRAGGILHVDAGPGGAEFNTDILLETGHTLSFEGSTADSFETTLTVVDPTADRTITIPDETGTMVTKNVAAGGGGLTEKIILTGTNNLGTSQLVIGAQGNSYINPSITQAQIYSDPVHTGGGANIDMADLHIKAGNIIYLNGGSEIVSQSNIRMNPNKTIKFEGSTDDSFETSLTVTDPTADRTITFPDSTGTVALQTSLLPSLRVQGSNNRTLTFGDSCLTVHTASGNTPANAAAARFRKQGFSTGLDILTYKDGNGYSSGIATNIDETVGGAVSLQDNTYIGMMYWQDNRTANKSHNFASLDTNGSTYRTMLSMKGDSTMEATFGGKVILPAAGVQFSDGTSQTTAASSGAGAATVYAYNMIFN